MESIANLTEFQDNILQWYSEEGRDLPWRHTRNPYHILVSEIMLHQTQVDRVIPKYLEFLRKYPSFQELASASTEEVEELWRPLGYNYRPKRLQLIAQKVIDEHNGQLPCSLADLMALPGIGRYTAGAILSFAFHVDAPILDTNVSRLLKRVFEVNGDPTKAEIRHQLWELAAKVIPIGKGYLINQALMDFGALICTARNPKCPECPISQICLTRQKQSTLESL